MAWQTPVFDRTQADVEYAKSQLEMGINNVAYKGCLNVTDINRIENDIQFLSDSLSAIYYFSKLESKSWDRSTLPTISEVERIIGNIQVLIDSYCQTADAPPLPTTMLTYEHINSIEENLYMLKHLMDGMKNTYRQCGTFVCGEE